MGSQTKKPDETPAIAITVRSLQPNRQGKNREKGIIHEVSSARGYQHSGTNGQLSLSSAYALRAECSRALDIDASYLNGARGNLEPSPSSQLTGIPLESFSKDKSSDWQPPMMDSTMSGTERRRRKLCRHIVLSCLHVGRGLSDQIPRPGESSRTS